MGGYSTSGAASVHTKHVVCERAAGITILLMFAVCSGQANTAEHKLESAAPASGKYLVVNHAQESVEPTRPALNIAGSIQATDSPAAHVAGAISSQFVEWYSLLGCHGKALAFEFLLIGCYVALRIGGNPNRRTVRGDPPEDQQAPKSPIGSNK
ncbi:MAG: hypothetical protein JWR21_95 [Herminiimonas sp.]|nr:hypothetical protein [Herminiimonas sp.]